jgi:hypothetical protein
MVVTLFLEMSWPSFFSSTAHTGKQTWCRRWMAARIDRTDALLAAIFCECASEAVAGQGGYENA